MKKLLLLVLFALACLWGRHRPVNLTLGPPAKPFLAFGLSVEGPYMMAFHDGGYTVLLGYDQDGSYCLFDAVLMPAERLR